MGIFSTFTKHNELNKKRIDQRNCYNYNWISRQVYLSKSCFANDKSARWLFRTLARPDLPTASRQAWL